MNQPIACVALLLAALAAACGSSPVPSTLDAEPSADAVNAPKYSELFDMFFAADTAGHCATAGCHADPDHTVWRCGPSASDCYAGMSEVGLIDTANPGHSAIVDAHRSPLTWLNPAGGNMPLDAQGANAAAADAIRAWVAAGAKND